MSKNKITEREAYDILSRKGIFPKWLEEVFERQEQEKIPDEDRNYYGIEELMRDEKSGDVLISLRNHYRDFSYSRNAERKSVSIGLYRINLEKDIAVKIERMEVSEDGLAAKFS
ncbi:Uncharacterised protein [uncultured archaeon]|nr:Uncharacterised protein [uncultured archaeon]